MTKRALLAASLIAAVASAGQLKKLTEDDIDFDSMSKDPKPEPDPESTTEPESVSVPETRQQRRARERREAKLERQSEKASRYVITSKPKR